MTVVHDGNTLRVETTAPVLILFFEAEAPVRGFVPDGPRDVARIFATLPDHWRALIEAAAEAERIG